MLVTIWALAQSCFMKITFRATILRLERISADSIACIPWLKELRYLWRRHDSYFRPFFCVEAFFAHSLHRSSHIFIEFRSACCLGNLSRHLLYDFSLHDVMNLFRCWGDVVLHDLFETGLSRRLRNANHFLTLLLCESLLHTDFRWNYAMTFPVVLNSLEHSFLLAFFICYTFLNNSWDKVWWKRSPCATWPIPFNGLPSIMHLSEEPCWRRHLQSSWW